MQDADAIVADCQDMIAARGIDPALAREVVVKAMLADQPLPLRGVRLTGAGRRPISRAHDDVCCSAEPSPPPCPHGTGALARLIVTRAAGLRPRHFSSDTSALLALLR